MAETWNCTISIKHLLDNSWWISCAVKVFYDLKFKTKFCWYFFFQVTNKFLFISFHSFLHVYAEKWHSKLYKKIKRRKTRHCALTLHWRDEVLHLNWGVFVPSITIYIRETEFLCISVVPTSNRRQGCSFDETKIQLNSYVIHSSFSQTITEQCGVQYKDVRTLFFFSTNFYVEVNVRTYVHWCIAVYIDVYVCVIPFPSEERRKKVVVLAMLV